MTFAMGDQVRVYPHGSPDQAAVGIVRIVSRNQLAIAVSFDDKPSFARVSHGLAIHPEFGVMMLAGRVAVGGEPVGPWIETFHKGHYEIEPVTNDPK